jgi:hypothetical protein
LYVWGVSEFLDATSRFGNLFGLDDPNPAWELNVVAKRTPGGVDAMMARADALPNHIQFYVERDQDYGFIGFASRQEELGTRR